MNRIPITAVSASNQAENVYLVPDGVSPAPARRLIVIVPPGKFDVQELAWKVSRLERQSRENVLLVGLASEPMRDNLLRARMDQLKSSLCVMKVETDSTLIFQKSWKEALPQVLADGDQLVCLEDHFTTGRLSRNVPLAQVLVAALLIPVYVIRGIRLYPENRLQQNGLREMLLWAGMLLTIVLFLVVQIQIQQDIPGIWGNILEFVTIGAEFSVVLGINSLGN